MSTEQIEMRSKLGDAFDRTFGSLDSRPDVTFTRLSPIQHVSVLVGITTNYTVQTAREKVEGGKSKDTVFITCLGTEGSIRIALPPDVADTIARQRDALSAKIRQTSAREAMKRRMAAGYKPSFGPRGKRTKKRKKRKGKPTTEKDS